MAPPILRPPTFNVSAPHSSPLKHLFPSSLYNCPSFPTRIYYHLNVEYLQGSFLRSRNIYQVFFPYCLLPSLNLHSQNEIPHFFGQSNLFQSPMPTPNSKRLRLLSNFNQSFHSYSHLSFNLGPH